MPLEALYLAALAPPARADHPSRARSRFKGQGRRRQGFTRPAPENAAEAATASQGAGKRAARMGCKHPIPHVYRVCFPSRSCDHLLVAWAAFQAEAPGGTIAWSTSQHSAINRPRRFPFRGADKTAERKRWRVWEMQTGHVCVSHTCLAMMSYPAKAPAFCARLPRPAHADGGRSPQAPSARRILAGTAPPTSPHRLAAALA